MLNYASVMLSSCNHTVLSELLLLVTFGQLSDGRHITPLSPCSRLLIQLSCISLNILLLLPGEGRGGSINKDPITIFFLFSLLSATTQTHPLFSASEMVRVYESDSLQSAPLIYTSLSDSPSRQLLPAASTQKSRMKLPTSDVWYHSNSEQPIRGLLGEEKLWGQ